MASKQNCHHIVVVIIVVIVVVLAQRSFVALWLPVGALVQCLPVVAGGRLGRVVASGCPTSVTISIRENTCPSACPPRCDDRGHERRSSTCLGRRRQTVHFLNPGRGLLERQELACLLRGGVVQGRCSVSVRGGGQAFTEAMRIVAPNSARQSFTQQQPQQQSSSKEIAVLIRLTGVQVARSDPSLSRPGRRCTMWSLALPSWLLRVSR